MADERTRLKRFTPVHRLWHLGLILNFMTMSVTGIAWMFYETPWGRGIANLFGGYSNTLQIHRIAGLVLLAGLALHLLYLLTRIDWKGFPRSLLGPETLVFQLVDVKGFIGHLGWVFGINQLPRYDRWSWWEKFDYWAVWWGLMIVGITGLMLYDPVLTSDYMPGWMLNVALWVHRIEAVLAMGYTFIIHFTIEHWRPSAFPFNAAMFDGTLDLEDAKHEHPEWVARLKREGRLSKALAIPPPVPLRIFYFLFGYSIIMLGVFLLVFAIVNAALLTLF
jgi:cytochrome b subunit of formate dehydrogenase